MVRHLCLALAVALALPAVGLPGWIALNRSDLPTVDDADLEPEVFSLPPDQDGWEDLQDAATQARQLDREGYSRLDAIRKREASDPDWIDELWRSHGGAFEALDRALSAPRISIPVFSVDDYLAEDTHVLLAITLLVRISAAQAQNLASRGDIDQAMDRAALGMRVGRKLSEAHSPNLLTLMFAVSAQSISLHELEHLLRATSPTRPKARVVIRQLESYRIAPVAWARVWASEYEFMKSTIRKMVEAYENDPGASSEDLLLGEEGGAVLRMVQYLPRDYLFQPNRTASEFAGIYRELADRSALDCGRIQEEQRGPMIGELPGSSPSLFWELMRPNFSGRMTVRIATPNFARFDLKRCHAATKISLMQSLVGLKAYLAETGELPRSLDQLVPDYLPTLPEDRFDGRPLRYSVESKTVYSIGEDFTDDGPPEEASQFTAGAPAIRL